MLLVSLSTGAQPQPPEQHDDLPIQPLSVYETNLKRYYTTKWQADRKEFETVHKKKWWYYLPNVGWAFGLPTVTLGTSTLAQIDRDKTVMKAKLDGIDAKAHYEYNEALLELRTRYRLLTREREHDRLERQLTDPVENSIMQIHTDAFTDQKITPLEHLQKKREHSRFKLQRHERRNELYHHWLELEQLARYQMPQETLQADEVNPEVKP
ncbi:hypothetical protein LX87_05659 [Larkinella arboricola]|uniref:Uncharacterized protein n=2 Tax=Larkinella arboricola TaxID=643671 RepID=A0A327WIR1_LARAB|nr:hypothetical protein LX87_05659 [Larkinella arboricola]